MQTKGVRASIFRPKSGGSSRKNTVDVEQKPKSASVVKAAPPL